MSNTELVTKKMNLYKIKKVGGTIKPTFIIAESMTKAIKISGVKESEIMGIEEINAHVIIQYTNVGVVINE